MRKTFGTGSTWEQTLGYSRAVQVDNTLYISATAASGEDGIVGDDFYTQTSYILQKLGAVLAEAGFGFEDVVQSKLYLTDISQVGRGRPRPRRGLRRHPPHALPRSRAAVPGSQDARRDRTRRPEERQLTTNARSLTAHSGTPHGP